MSLVNQPAATVRLLPADLGDAMNRSSLSPGGAALERGSSFKAPRKPLKRGRRKPRPSLDEFHEAVIREAGGRCGLEDEDCFGRLWGHHYVSQNRIRRTIPLETTVDELWAALADSRNGVALCIFHHAQVENARVECPRPPELDGFLADFGLIERRAA